MKQNFTTIPRIAAIATLRGMLFFLTEKTAQCDREVKKTEPCTGFEDFLVPLHVN